MTLSEELQWRGFIADTTITDFGRLDQEPIGFYCGFDASAPSQTIGNLASLMAVKTFLRHGHQAVLLAGGATSLIGDPGGKTNERELALRDEIRTNTETAKKQIATVLDGYDFRLVNNIDWLGNLNLIDYLRGVGKHFSMSHLIKRDYIAQRLGPDSDGISYAEFSYGLLQAYDFWHLFKKYGCRLQIGGADQWGNCLLGVNLIQKLEGARVDAITIPLVINQATGQKFGKSESGAVWLDREMTSAYDFYQFWLNSDDAGVDRYLRIFSELDQTEIAKVIADHSRDPSKRLAQKKLAESVTSLVHGQSTKDLVEDLTKVVFAESEDTEISLKTADFVAAIKANRLAPVLLIDQKAEIVKSISGDLDLARSNSDARQLIAAGAISVSGATETVSLKSEASTWGEFFQKQPIKPWGDRKKQFWVVKRGKNRVAIIQPKN